MDLRDDPSQKWVQPPSYFFTWFWVHVCVPDFECDSHALKVNDPAESLRAVCVEGCCGGSRIALHIAIFSGVVRNADHIVGRTDLLLSSSCRLSLSHVT